MHVAGAGRLIGLPIGGPAMLSPTAPRPVRTTFKKGPFQQHRRRGDLGVREGGKAPFPTEGPLGKAIVGGVFLGPVGAMFGYFFGLGVEGERNVEKAKEVKARPGVTKDMIQQAKELGRELEECERSLEQNMKAVSEARLTVADLEASVTEASNDAKAAMQAGDEARAEQFMVEREKRKGHLEAAKDAMLEAMARREAARNALMATEERALVLDASIQENMAISKARMEGSPALKRMAENEEQGEQAAENEDEGKDSNDRGPSKS